MRSTSIKLLQIRAVKALWQPTCFMQVERQALQDSAQAERRAQFRGPAMGAVACSGGRGTEAGMACRAVPVAVTAAPIHQSRPKMAQKYPATLQPRVLVMNCKAGMNILNTTSCKHCHT
jgi:hypothetical protein